MVQKLSSKQQNHLKEGHKGGLCLNLLENCLNFFEGNLELLTLMKFDEKWTSKIMWFSKIDVGLS